MGATTSSAVYTRVLIAVHNIIAFPNVRLRFACCERRWWAVMVAESDTFGPVLPRVPQRET